jgi:hypothetical protein
MHIKIRNFEIVVGEQSYDLYEVRPPKQLHKIKDPNGDVKVCLGYFSKLENVINKLIQVELSNRDEITDLRNFLEVYRSIYDDILNTINTQSCNQ